jgi:hypothetical protein
VAWLTSNDKQRRASNGDRTRYDRSRDLITPEQAKALVEKGKTLGEWLMEQEKGKAGETRKVGQTMLDRMGLLALLLFNFAMLAGIGWIVFRIARSL